MQDPSTDLGCTLIQFTILKSLTISLKMATQATGRPTQKSMKNLETFSLTMLLAILHLSFASMKLWT